MKEKKGLEIVVCLKDILDPKATLKINESGLDIKKEGLNFELNLFDEIAVEAAIRIRKKHGGSITFITVGPQERSMDILATALSMDTIEIANEPTIVNRAILVDDSTLEVRDNPLLTAKILAKVIADIGNVDIIFCGKQKIDDGMGYVPIAIAELLNLPQLSAVTELELAEDKKIKASLQIEGGKKIVERSLPVLLTCERGLVDSFRSPNIACITTAGEKIRIDSASFPAELKSPKTSNIKLLKLSLPPERKPGIVIDGKTDQEKASKLAEIIIKELKIN